MCGGAGLHWGGRASLRIGVGQGDAVSALTGKVTGLVVVTVGWGVTSDPAGSVRYRPAMMLLASAGGNRMWVIAQLAQDDEDTVRDVIHRFNEIGPACLDPSVGGRPSLPLSSAHKGEKIRHRAR